jgi:hypothetical protein
MKKILPVAESDITKADHQMEKEDKKDGPRIVGIEGKETLEGTPAEDVRGAGEKRPIGESPVSGPREREGDDVRPDRPGVETMGGMEPSDEGVDLPPDRGGRSPAGREPERVGDTRPGGIVKNTNYVISSEDNLGVGGPAKKYNDNVAAIKLLKKIEAEKRPATGEEQAVLVKYVGWVGLPQAFDWRKESDWFDRYTELKELLTLEELRAARSSTLNAHYTSEEVTRDCSPVRATSVLYKRRARGWCKVYVKDNH